MWIFLWTKLAVASSTIQAFPGFDPSTQNIYDWYICNSSAVFLGRVERSVCVNEWEVFDIRVERSFKGTFDATVQATTTPCRQRDFSQGLISYPGTPFNHPAPVFVSEYAVFFLNANADRDAPLTRGHAEAYLVPYETEHGVFARTGSPRRLTYVADLSVLPEERSETPIFTDVKEAATRATVWEVVLEQLDEVAKRQPATRCVPAVDRR